MLRLLAQVSRVDALGDAFRKRCTSFFGASYCTLHNEIFLLDESAFRHLLKDFETNSSTKNNRKKLNFLLLAGEYLLQNGFAEEARAWFFNGLDLAGEIRSQEAQIWCIRHLIHIGHQLGKWENLEDLYRQSDRLLSEMDFIPEKITNLAEFALFAVVCGDEEASRQALKVARQLNEVIASGGDGDDGTYLRTLLHLVRARSAHRFGQPLEAMEQAQQGLEFTNDLEQKPFGRMHVLKIDLKILLVECSLDLALCDVADEEISEIRDFLARFPDSAALKQVNLLLAVTRLKFENYPLSSAEWSTLILENLAEGNVDFALALLGRIHHEVRHHYPPSLYDGLQKAQDEWLKKYSQNVPEKYRQSFLSTHGFVDRRDGPATQHEMMMKLVELTSELVSLHDMDLLARKVLKTVLDLTHMSRGVILFRGDGETAVKATHGILPDELKKKDTLESLSLELMRYCLEHNLKVSISDWTSDELFQKAFSDEKRSGLWRKIDAKSMIVYPFVMNGVPLGVIYLDSPLRRPADARDEMVFLDNFATIVAVALNNAHTINSKDRDLIQVRRALTRQQMQLVEKYSIRNFLGVSPMTKRLLEVVEKISDSSATVLLTGESGVGKELVAKTIHYSSPCCDRRFVAVNCAAIPDTLLESVLFGYRKGSFTDAHEDKIGLFQEAHGGTIFLDEIGEMPLNMQVKLLRVLEEGEVLPIGAGEPVKINARVVCATNRDLEDMVLQGTFRQDLYYRINVVTIHVPCLRERRQDVPIFVQHALKMYAQENETEPKTVSAEALDYLIRYDWPGNIRELINVMFNLSIFVERPRIELDDLESRPELFQSGGRRVLVDSHDPILSLSEKIDAGELTLSDAKQEFERLQILRALRLTSGKVTTASSMLKMPRPQVSRLIKKYGIRRDLTQ